jgi:Signal transduction histidine kinase
MFQELRSMRMRLTIYYTLVLALSSAVLIAFVFYNFFYSNRFTVDRDLKLTALQVNDLHALPVLEMPPNDENIADDNKPTDYLFKLILRDENMNITQSSVPNDELVQGSQELAQQTWMTQQENWDTVLLDGFEYRFFSIPYHNKNNGVVQSYCNLTMLHKLLSRFIYLPIASGIIAIVFAALMGWWLAGRAMMPIRIAWQRQKEFIGDVSHELRTPLTVVQSNLDVAIADEEGSIRENMNWLQNAYTETENMGKLINDLLFLARIDAREIQFDYHEFDLSELLTRLVTQFTPLFQGKNLKFASDIESDIQMYGDDIRIRQVINIFLDNASKYTPAGGCVRLEMHKKQHAIEILVADNGIGFDESEKDNIFRRFYRIDKTRSRKQGGTGLGLPIAAWIVNEHRGNIQVFSKTGKGSIFKAIFSQNQQKTLETRRNRQDFER